VGAPKWKLGSYHATQGTVRPAPAKSIDGASASTVGSMLSDAGEPWVTHAPFLKARTKICWESPSFCSNVAQGTWTLPATTVPPATSTRPASSFGSIEFAASSLTWAPFDGSDTKAADAGDASIPARSVAGPCHAHRQRAPARRGRRLVPSATGRRRSGCEPLRLRREPAPRRSVGHAAARPADARRAGHPAGKPARRREPAGARRQPRSRRHLLREHEAAH